MEPAMRTTKLLENLQFHDRSPYAQPLYVADDGRVIRFMLQPGQSITEHHAPSSPFYVVILQGRGVFSGADGVEQSFGPNDLLIFDKGEHHAVRALDEPLIFVGFLHGVEGTRPDKVGGLLGNP
jgi:quercetin dioxygenase-like cupin family protein